MTRCDDCPAKGTNCEKMVEASVPVPDSFTFYNLDKMTCREANHNGYDYHFIDSRELIELNPEYLKRKPDLGPDAHKMGLKEIKKTGAW